VALSKWLLAGNCISMEGTSVVTLFREWNTLNSAAAARRSWGEEVKLQMQAPPLSASKTHRFAGALPLDSKLRPASCW
jgi:hypothetical protein